MAWSSYLEDLRRRIDEAEHRCELLTESSGLSALERAWFRLSRLRREILRAFEALQEYLELATDPSVNLLNENARLSSELHQLRIRRANEVSRLKTKIETTRMDYEKRIKELKRRRR